MVGLKLTIKGGESFSATRTVRDLTSILENRVRPEEIESWGGREWQDYITFQMAT